MTDKQKVRVIAPMPMLKKPLYPIIAFLLLISLVGTYYGILHYLAPKKAVPMGGDCIDAPVQQYTDKDKDAQICTWRNSKYWCAYDPNKNAWACSLIVPPPTPAAPAEAPAK